MTPSRLRQLPRWIRGSLSCCWLQRNGVATSLWEGMAAGSNSLHVPAARRRRIGRRLVGIRALKADPTGLGQCCPTLLIAREIAGHWSNHPVPKVSRAPLMRLRRCRLHSAKQHPNDQEKRSGGQTHGRLPARISTSRFYDSDNIGALRTSSAGVRPRLGTTSPRRTDDDRVSH